MRGDAQAGTIGVLTDDRRTPEVNPFGVLFCRYRPPCSPIGGCLSSGAGAPHYPLVLFL